MYARISTVIHAFDGPLISQLSVRRRRGREGGEASGARPRGGLIQAIGAANLKTASGCVPGTPSAQPWLSPIDAAHAFSSCSLTSPSYLFDCIHLAHDGRHAHLACRHAPVACPAEDFARYVCRASLRACAAPHSYLSYAYTFSELSCTEGEQCAGGRDQETRVHPRCAPLVRYTSN